MSSTFSSALANLDVSLQSVRTEIDTLGAAMDVDDSRLNHSLTDARYQAAALRDMIRAERPGAEWKSRQALDRLVIELDLAVKARRNQHRRSKLLALAYELEAGKVRHRFDTRAAALNHLRVDAIGELRREAGLTEDLKDLPGPKHSEWLHWACNLQEARDTAVLAELRGNFVAIERFISEMEESYWAAGQPVLDPALLHDLAAATAAEGERERPHGFQQFKAGPAITPEPPLQNVREEFDNASRTGNYEKALSLCYDNRFPEIPTPAFTEPERSHSVTERPHTAPERPHSATPPPPSITEPSEALIDVIASAPHTKYCESCGGTFPDEFSLCPFDHAVLAPLVDPPRARRDTSGRSNTPRPYRGSEEGRSHTRVQPSPRPVTPSPAASAGKVAEPAPQKRNGDDAESSENFNTVKPRNKWIITGGSAGVVVLTVGLAAGFHLNSSANSRSARNPVQLSVQTATLESSSAPEFFVQKEVEQKQQS